MDTFLIIVNNKSGHSCNFDRSCLTDILGSECSIIYDEIGKSEKRQNPADYENLVIVGGDGTLNHAVNELGKKPTKVTYIPTGTLNDLARSERRTRGEERSLYHTLQLGRIGANAFTYVAAAGSFTEIGYATDERKKKKTKTLAYLMKVLSAYKVFQIPCKIEVENKVKEGDYTLIMAVKSRCCFGFPFNKLYDCDKCQAQLITIKAPKNKGLLGKIQMFFPFFRVFFLGIDKEIEGKYLNVHNFNRAKLTLLSDTPFCVDGERLDIKGEQEIYVERTHHEIRVKDVAGKKKTNR